MQQHEDTITGFTTKVAEQPDTLALVVVGSVARGQEKPESDVDVYLVLTDAAYQAAGVAGRIAYIDREASTYGSYVDIKLASPGYLRAAIDRADDPTRASFVGARVVLDRIGDVPATVERIVTLPEAAWSRRVHAYRCQARLYGGYFLRQACERGEAFLLRHSAVHLCVATGRAALAAHRRLFAGQKYLAATLAELPGLPDGFVAAWHGVLTDPTPESAGSLLELMDRWQGGPLSVEESLSGFIADNELAWLSGTIPPEFW